MSGDIIFFDWKDSNGNQDGISDHVGIVNYYDIESNKVYTIEGNSNDECREKSYNKDDIEIFGYGRSNFN